MFVQIYKPSSLKYPYQITFHDKIKFLLKTTEHTLYHTCDSNAISTTDVHVKENKKTFLRFTILPPQYRIESKLEIDTKCTNESISLMEIIGMIKKNHSAHSTLHTEMNIYSTKKTTNILCMDMSYPRPNVT